MNRIVRVTSERRLVKVSTAGLKVPPAGSDAEPARVEVEAVGR